MSKKTRQKIVNQNRYLIKRIEQINKELERLEVQVLLREPKTWGVF